MESLSHVPKLMMPHGCANGLLTRHQMHADEHGQNLGHSLLHGHTVNLSGRP